MLTECENNEAKLLSNLGLALYWGAFKMVPLQDYYEADE